MALRYEDELTSLIAAQTKAGTDDPVPRMAAGMLGSLCRLAFGSIGWPSDRVRSRKQIEEGIERAFDQIGVGLAEYRDGSGRVPVAEIESQNRLERTLRGYTDAVTLVGSFLASDGSVSSQSIEGKF